MPTVTLRPVTGTLHALDGSLTPTKILNVSHSSVHRRRRQGTKTEAAATPAAASNAALFDGPRVDTQSELAVVTAEMVPVDGLLRCIETGAVFKRQDDSAINTYPDLSSSGGLKWN